MPIPIPLNKFRGIYDRGESESIPLDHLKDSRNVRYIDNGFETRKGFSVSVETPSVRRFKEFELQGQAPRILILDNDGKLFDSTNAGTPILEIAGMTDFSMVSMFSRAYISPHNGTTGLAGEKIYVYDGTGTARPIGGTAPTGQLSVTTTANSGNLEVGKRIFAVSFVTASGFVTKPGAFVTYDTPGGFTALVGDVPVGPPGTVSRRILATKILIDFNNDFQNQEYFFVPSGDISNNDSGQTKEVSFFDADLQSSADYLFDQLEEIPAGVFLSTYRGALVVGGEDANRDIARISKFGEPESFDSIEGYIELNPGDSKFGVRNAVEHRDNLYLFKYGNCYVTQDNGDNPAFWNYLEVDGSIGTDCHGIAMVINKESGLLEGIVVAGRPGLYFFNGAFPQIPLTHKIENIWSRINKTVFHKVQVAIDTHAKLIYVSVPLDSATEPSHLLVCDYLVGLSPDTVVWDIWDFPEDNNAILVTLDTSTKKPKILYGSLDGNIYHQDASTDDHGIAIDSYGRTAYLGLTDEQVTNNFGEMRFRIQGAGILSLACYGLEDVYSLAPPSFTLSYPNRWPLMRTMNFVDSACSIRFRTNAVGAWFRIQRLTVYVSPEALSRPNTD